MARFHELLEHLFGPNMTEERLKEAFTLDHPGFVSHPMASVRNETILVLGDFNTSSTTCSYAGRFERYFYRTGGNLVACHSSIVVEERFRRQGIAFRHFSKLAKFYDMVSVDYVHLEAVGYGPVVWPQFGFELREPGDRELLHGHYRSIIGDLGYEVIEIPTHTPRLALTPQLEGVDVGLEALSRLYESLNKRPIPMILDLKGDARTRAFLESRGILAPQGGS